MKKYLLILIVLSFLSVASPACAAQITTKPIVLQDRVAVRVSTTDTAVNLTVWNGGTIPLLGPITTTVTAENKNKNGVLAVMDISTLKAGTKYTLIAKDKNLPDALGSTVDFTTLAAPVAGECKVVYANFSPSGETPKAGWYVKDKTKVEINVRTENCVGEKIYLSLIEDDTGIGAGDYLSDSKLEDREITVPSDSFTIVLSAGEEECESGLTGAIGYDCHYYFHIQAGTGKPYTSWDDPNNEGQLYYECDGACNDNWALVLPIIGKDSAGHVIATDTITDHSFSKDYQLLAPIGDLTTVKNGTSFGDYLNTIFKIAIGLCGALAVVMIIINAITIIGTSESVFGRSEAKSRMTSAIIGLLIALGSYALLNTINPNLVGGNINVANVTVELSAIENIPASQFTNITGKTLLPPSTYDAEARAAAKTAGVPYCALRIILQEESRSNPGAIGFDSNVANKDVPARRAFIDSLKKYTGNTFTVANTTTAILDKTLVNDDKAYTNTDDLGLDWRFSHGLGLTQITCQPKTSDFTLRKNLPNCTFNGVAYTPKQLIDPEKNLEAGARLWGSNYTTCGKDIFRTWKAYNAGSCDANNPFTVAQAQARTALYNQCVVQNPQ